eukprot:10104711-Lingulodinium_polyedra.AAC.1
MYTFAVVAAPVVLPPRHRPRLGELGPGSVRPADQLQGCELLGVARLLARAALRLAGLVGGRGRE